MKKIIVIILVVLMAAAMVLSCSSSKTSAKFQGKEVTFEYNAYTRGSSVNYKVTKDSVIQNEKLRGENTLYKKPTPKDDWQSLLTATEKVDLEKLETIEVTSKKHQFDGAMGATLLITVDGKEYRSPTFDHGTPPAEIKGIIDEITLL
jgi:ABC-type oligopeptide transport system substrate-binding subunit